MSEFMAINKKIYSISMVKNGSDIIESFVRYNLNIFDGMIILDNNSTDDTLKILRLLENEGLPLFIIEDDDNEYNQAVKTNRLLLKVITDFKADIIVPLDVDEFFISSDKGNPRKILEKIESPTFSLVKWRSYVPTFDSNEKFIPSKITFAIDDDLEENYKVILPRELVENYDVKLSTGNHKLIYDQKYENLIKQVFSTNLRIAHFPIRSKEQITSKILVGWINTLHDTKRSDKQSWHWLNMFNEFKSNGEFKDEDIISFAKTYSLANVKEEVNIKKDPIDLSFCKDIDIRYDTGVINPFMNLLKNCEQISLDYLNFKKEALSEEMRLKNQIKNLEKEKLVKDQELKNKIREYESSTSWIITSPLRKIMGRIKNLRN